jgi:hypothetical protein
VLSTMTLAVINTTSSSLERLFLDIVLKLVHGRII